MSDYKKQLMKLTLLICLALSFVTCSDDDDHRANTCSVIDPVTQLDWLKGAIALYDDGPVDLMVEQGTYLFKTVFILTPCCPVCSVQNFVIPPVYTCEGVEIKDLYPNDTAIKDRNVIWKTPAEEATCW